MNHVQFLLHIVALVCVATGFKVNLQGSVSLGKDVVETISHYLGKTILIGRRSLDPPPTEDPITYAVREAQICKDLQFCHDEQQFVNEYVIILAKAVSSILSNSELKFRNAKYEEQLKQNLELIRNILQDANAKVENDSEVYYWLHVIKRINAIFQKKKSIDRDPPGGIGYNNTPPPHIAEKMELQYKIVVAAAFIERKYLVKLCSEHNFCSKSHQCTNALNKLLIHFKTMPEDRIRMFIKYFYEALFDTSFYSFLSQSSASEFQIVLNDMTYANDTPVRDILSSVHMTVEARLVMLQVNKGLVVAHDILIAHVILSDIDHMFSNNTNAFTIFLNKFYEWLASGAHLEKAVRAVMTDISKQIHLFEEDLVRKLTDEVSVFLEMTV